MQGGSAAKTQPSSIHLRSQAPWEPVPAHTVWQLAEAARRLLRTISRSVSGHASKVLLLLCCLVFVCLCCAQVPIAMVTFVDKDRVWIKSVQGLSGLRQVDRRKSLCAW